MNYCPYKMANPELTPHFVPERSCDSDRDWDCEKESCALWNEHFGMCGFAVDAHLKGHEDWRREKAAERKDRE